MKVYKILHKPTGLYFTPSKGYGNLSKNGKIYPKVPQLRWANAGIRIQLRVWSGKKPTKHQQTIIDYFEIGESVNGGYWFDKTFPCSIDEWEIIEL